MARWRVGERVVDSSDGTVASADRVVRLEPRVMAIVLLLIERRGTVVPQDVLLTSVWADTHLAPGAVARAVSVIRSAFGDDSRDPRYVETVPKRGYRLIAPVEEVAAEGPKRPPAPAELPRVPARRAARTAAVAALAALTLLVPGSILRRAPDPIAAAAYAKGIELTAQGETGRRQSVAEFRKAIALEPSYSAAHVAMGESLFQLGRLRHLSASEAFREARTAAREALRYEPSAQAHLLLANAALYGSWDWDEAERELSAAQALAPDEARVFTLYAQLHSVLGRHGQAVAAIERAETLAPESPIVLAQAGLIHERAGRPTIAAHKLELALSFGAAKWGHFLLFNLHRRQGRVAESFEHVRQIVKLSGFEMPSSRGPEYGVKRFLTATRDDLLRRPPVAEAQPMRIAMIHAALGEDAASLDWVERAAAERDPSLVELLRDLDFDRLRSHERFVAITDRLRVPR
jgi:DNA-binding winged helix-turn-helix (wHTH) protein